MTIPRRFLVALFASIASLAFGACGSTGTSSTVQSGGTPVNPFTNPGAANLPSAPLTGAQSQRP